MYAVIMAGGSGTRFWPISRHKKPKQFLSISGKAPMIVETCNRLNPIIPDEKIIIVLGQEHFSEASVLFQDRGIHILAEPMGRNTAPCMGLGALYAETLGGKEPVAFLPADHFIADPSSFLESLQQAEGVVQKGGIVTLGIIPTRPETGYGYIKKGGPDPSASPSAVYRVAAFTEKPDLEKATHFLISGLYYWNAGIFVATPETILTEIEKHLPDLYLGLKPIKGTIGTNAFDKTLSTAYESLKAVSFDYGVMEKTREPVYVLPCDCGWSDVGSWESLYDLKKQDHDDARNLCEGETLLIDCENSFISSTSGRLVACLGVDNCLVVDTPDALLIANRNRSQDIRLIVERLKKEQKEGLL
jgi:mannose-1-phosphate guanylyltransferase